MKRIKRLRATPKVLWYLNHEYGLEATGAEIKFYVGVHKTPRERIVSIVDRRRKSQTW